MAALTPVRVGQANLAGGVTANFLKVFAGETLMYFEQAVTMRSRTMYRSIPSGVSATFPNVGKGTAATYHTPGAFIAGSPLAMNERVVTIDDLCIVDRSLALIDDLMSHWDHRQALAQDVARALARQYDINAIRTLILTARAASNVTGVPGGGAFVSATSRTNADVLITAMFDAKTVLDGKDIPPEDRFILCTYAQHNLIVNSGSRAVDVDFNPETNGSVRSGRVYRVAGFELVPTNNLPQGNVTTGPTKYQGNFTNTSFIAAHKSAMGTVGLLDVAVEMDWLIQNQAWLMVGKYLVGHGILRPEAAVEVTVV